MLGALIGDYAGSRFEWNNIKNKEFAFFHKSCHFTDDSIMTMAVAKAIMDSSREGKISLEELGGNSVRRMQELGGYYPHAGYGGHFAVWLRSDDPKPYGSFGNGSAMRVSPAGDIAATMEEAMALAGAVTEVTHDHPEGLKGAEAVAVAIFMARQGKKKEEIRDYITYNYYHIDFTLDDIRAEYTFDVTCQGSVPQALEAFFESVDFEDAVRNAISIGGDSDTIAAITGSIAEAYYGIPDWISYEITKRMNRHQKKIVDDWYRFLGRK